MLIKNDIKFKIKVYLKSIYCKSKKSLRCFLNRSFIALYYSAIYSASSYISTIIELSELSSILPPSQGRPPVWLLYFDLHELLLQKKILREYYFSTWLLITEKKYYESIIFLLTQNFRQVKVKKNSRYRFLSYAEIKKLYIFSFSFHFFLFENLSLLKFWQLRLFRKPFDRAS